jgi:hypothetical protein
MAGGSKTVSHCPAPEADFALLLAGEGSAGMPFAAYCIDKNSSIKSNKLFNSSERAQQPLTPTI